MAGAGPGLLRSARGLAQRYGRRTASDDADFELMPGAVLAETGDNGAGQTSAIKALTDATVPNDGENR
ncbi:sugar ABC transporter ATP-binding protein, partial [Streptomyces sp. PA03-6a]|nr:sugar ABC transporter ATP-binding protein [Streptomyces sp. PA03-6a]